MQCKTIRSCKRFFPTCHQSTRVNLTIRKTHWPVMTVTGEPHTLSVLSCAITRLLVQIFMFIFYIQRYFSTKTKQWELIFIVQQPTFVLTTMVLYCSSGCMFKTAHWSSGESQFLSAKHPVSWLNDNTLWLWLDRSLISISFINLWPSEPHNCALRNRPPSTTIHHLYVQFSARFLTWIMSVIVPLLPLRGRLIISHTIAKLTARVVITLVKFIGSSSAHDC